VDQSLNTASSDLVRWIILLPLIGSIVNGVFNRSKNAFLAGGIATLASVSAFIVSLNIIFGNNILSDAGTHLVVDQWFTWFEIARIKVPFHLEVTPVIAIMLLVVTGIGTLIHVYATGYMSHEESPWRFFSYLNLFLSAMLVLILSSNLVGVFLGWEGVGLCSYLLIGYWYKADANTEAGMKAFVTNRIGDLGFLIALFAAFAYLGTGQVREIVEMVNSGRADIPSWVWVVVTGGIFWASTGKSAQIPLYVWLPDAMAGPTPVSALIHAATMVTSGIVVTTRLWPVFAGQQDVLNVMFVIGIATAYVAALTALTQRDIKKVLAYSTVSQLGFMFAALGAGAPAAALFHVVTHACFKALLFLGAGSVIHGMHEKQDLFEMGGLKKHMPFTHWTFLIATLAIIGFPLSSGFFSKDLILAKAFGVNPVAYFLLLGAALLTAFYMFRCYSLAFQGKARTKEADHAHESSFFMTVPLMVLAVLSIFVGWLETPVVIFDIHQFERWVNQSWYGVKVEAHAAHMSHAMEWALMGLTSVLSLGLAYYSYKKYSQFKQGEKVKAGFWHQWSENKFYVDEFYQTIFIRPLAVVAKNLAAFVDIKVINGGLHILKSSVRVAGEALSLFHTGNVQTYAWYFAFGTAAALLLVWFKQGLG
jgi:NADH-quinone oxidoreductase subunit L